MPATFKVISPYDGAEVDTAPLHSATEAEAMLAKAARLHEHRDGWLPAHQRIAILKKLAGLVEKHKEAFALLIAREGGKPLVDARVEVARAIDGIDLAAAEIRCIHGTEIPMGQTAASMGRMAFTTKEPAGVVLAISAFNHPLNLIVHQVIPAVATGCPVIVKPASATPLNCLKLVELLHEAGLPEDWCQVCICDNETARKLAADERLAFLTFIGSAKVGWMLRSTLAPGVHCALEHGGVAPVIVDESVDLDSIVPPLVKGGFYHAGQVCVSVQRIYAPEKIALKLAEKIAAAAAKLKVGDPTDAKTEVGPLIRAEEADRVEMWISAAVKAGAALLTGGKKFGKTAYAPTVLLNPPDNAKVSTDEIFGPLVSIYGHKKIDEAIRRANALPYAFQAAVFSENIKVALDTAKRLSATAVMINDHTAFRVDWMPFGGRKRSGLGFGGIGYTMCDMLAEKMIVMKG